MSDELVKWECPNCGNDDEDIDLQKTHCSGCGLVVFVSDGGAVSQDWFVDLRPTPRALDGANSPRSVTPAPPTRLPEVEAPPPPPHQ